MDPQACFFAFLGCVEDGEKELALDCAESYADWVKNGGFRAEDTDGAVVMHLDHCNGRYLVNHEGNKEWRKAKRGLKV